MALKKKQSSMETDLRKLCKIAKMFVSCILKARLDNAYFRKAAHARVISKKRNMLVNLRQFEDKIILKS